MCNRGEVNNDPRIESRTSFFRFFKFEVKEFVVATFVSEIKCSGHILQEPQAEEHRPTVKSKQHCAYKNSEIQKPMKIARN